MAVLRPKPTSPSTTVTEMPRIHDVNHESVMVDAKFVPLSSLITFVSGYAWTVDYYSQVITRDSALAGHDPNLPGQFQQYKLIRNLDLKANDPIRWSQDPTSKSITASGNSSMHSMVVPNAGDMFVAEVGDGRRAVFQVKNTEKKSILTQSVYSFDYTMIFFTDTEKERYADLESKVVQTFHYVRDFILHGQNPLVTTDEFNTIEKLSELYQEMIENYCGWFFNDQFKTFTVPGQDLPHYDPFLVEYISKTTTSLSHRNLRDLIVLNTDDDYQLRKPSVLQAIYERNSRTLDLSFRKYGTVAARSFYYNPVANGIRFSGVSQVIYPLGTDQAQEHNLNSIDWKSPTYTPFSPSKTHGGDFYQATPDNILEYNGLQVPIIKPVQIDDYYIFSQQFYEKDAGQSLMEVLVHNFIADRQNQPKDIYTVVQNYHNWGTLEAFYYIPVMLTLITGVIRRM